MKVFNMAFCLLLFISAYSFAQIENKPPHHMRERLSQLEKIKLIETLEMDEETTLKFFARRNEHQMKIDQLVALGDEAIQKMEVILKSGKYSTTEELKSLIEEANSIHSRIEQEKSNFINSLEDILSTEQIAKLIIFERKFKDELKRVLFRDRKFKNRE